MASLIMMMIGAGILVVWQPWKASRAHLTDEPAEPESVEPAVPSEVFVEDEPATPETHPVEPADASTTESAVERGEQETPSESPAEERRTERVDVTEQATPAVTEPPQESSPQDAPEVRVLVNTDPWGNYTLSGDRQGSGDCPYISKLPAGEYTFLLSEPESGATHTMTIQIEGNEGEIKRCWSFIKDGPC